MPNYGIVTEEYLKEWALDLLKGFRSLRDNINIDAFCFQVIKLYEYIQCYAGFHVGNEHAGSVTGKLSDVKHFVGGEAPGLIHLFGLRNKLSHENKDVLPSLLELLSDDLFLRYLSRFDLEDSLCDDIKYIVDIIENSERIKLNCISDCELLIRQIKGTDQTLEYAINVLKAKYPNNIVYESLSGCVSTHTIAESKGMELTTP